MARLTHSATELGAGFAFAGRQYRLAVGQQDYYLDLLFFHLGLRRFVVFDETLWGKVRCINLVCSCNPRLAGNRDDPHAS